MPSTITIPALTTELTTDPKALGYAAFIAAGNDTGLADLLNNTYAAVGTVWKQAMTPAEVLKSLVWTELSTKTQVQIEILQLLLQPASIDVSQQTIRDIFVGLFPTGTTLANLTANAKVTNPTRGEELWGSGTRVSLQQVIQALGR